MDRFIVKLDGYTTVPYWHLKSNMDRFIGPSSCAIVNLQRI